MNTAKLREALEEMKTHRGVIDEAISHLESALSLLEVKWELWLEVLD